MGWSHGDAEIFTKEQFISWFDLESLGKSPAQFSPEKLIFLNHHYIQNADSQDLAKRTIPFAIKEGIYFEGEHVVNGSINNVFTFKIYPLFNCKRYCSLG